MRKYQGRHKSNIKTLTHWSRCSGVYTALLCSLAFCRIRYKGPQKQICWYYDFFQTLSSFLWVLCHQNRASHRWLVYEQILDQVPWHLPIKKVVCLFLNRNKWKENGKYTLLLWNHTRNTGIAIVLLTDWKTTWGRSWLCFTDSLFMTIRKVYKT